MISSCSLTATPGSTRQSEGRTGMAKGTSQPSFPPSIAWLTEEGVGARASKISSPVSMKANLKAIRSRFSQRMTGLSRRKIVSKLYRGSTTASPPQRHSRSEMRKPLGLGFSLHRSLNSLLCLRCSLTNLHSRCLMMK